MNLFSALLRAIDKLMVDTRPIGDYLGDSWRNDDVVSYENGNPHGFWEPDMGPKKKN